MTGFLRVPVYGFLLPPYIFESKSKSKNEKGIRQKHKICDFMTPDSQIRGPGGGKFISDHVTLMKIKYKHVEKFSHVLSI